MIDTIAVFGPGLSVSGPGLLMTVLGARVTRQDPNRITWIRKAKPLSLGFRV